MAGEISAALVELERLKNEIRTVKGAQIFTNGVKNGMHALASRYFSQVRTSVTVTDEAEKDLAAADALFQELHALSRKNPSKEKSLVLLKSAKALFVRLEGFTLRGAKAISAGLRTPADDLILESLQDICPAAALSYSQALIDLQSETRSSYRGPATDLREALRETLDTLAPDKDVESTPGYKVEADAKRPTMKQKTRYILRSRGVGSSQMATPESAVEGIEGMLGSVVRSVYTRSSVSTHTATTRKEVLRVLTWVRVVIGELLELPT